MHLGQLSRSLVDSVLALDGADVRIQYHPHHGDRDPEDVPPAERIVKENVAEGQDQAGLQMPQDLVGDRRGLPDDQERAEVDRDRQQAGQHDERLK